MAEKMKRAGGIWEGVGFLMIVGGMVFGMATGPDNHVGGIVGCVGFAVFLVGRFK